MIPPLKFAHRVERKWYSRVVPGNNSFACSNLLNDQKADPVKAGRIWLLCGWEFRLIGPNVNVNQIDSAIHLCPPNTLATVFAEGLIQTPPSDPGTMQLEFGFQTTSAAGPTGVDVGGSFMGSTTGKWPLIVPEGWFVAAYFLSTTNNNFTAGNTVGSLKLLIVDLALDELCHEG